MIDVLLSSYNIYMTWSGRVLPNFLMVLFLYLGKFAFSIVNSFIFIAIMRETKKLLQKYDKRIKFFNKEYLFLFALIWFLIPVFNQDFIGLVSSINYSWMLLILLVYIVNFENIKTKKLLFFSFFLGLTNESIVIFSNLFLFYKKIIKKEKIKLKNFISLWLGSVVQIFSIGNFKRKFYSDSIASTYPFVQKLNHFFSMEHVVLIGKILVIILLLYIYLKKIKKIDIFMPKDLVIISVITLVMLLILMPRNEPRAYLIPFYFLIFSILLGINSIGKYSKYLKSFINIIVIFILGLSLKEVLPLYLKIIPTLVKERNFILKQYKNQNFKEVAFWDNQEEYNKINFSHSVVEPLFLDSKIFSNIVFSKYHNFEKVYSIPRKSKLLIIELKNDIEEIIEISLDKDTKNISSIISKENEIIVCIPYNVKEVEIKNKNIAVKTVKIIEVGKGKIFEKKESKKIEIE